MINDFHKQGFEFLSNFYPSVIYPNYIKYPTVEHAYQAHKIDPKNSLGRELIRRAKTPGEAKRMGGKVLLRPNWDNMKLDIMFQLLRMKFTIPELKEKLLSTGDEELVEGNSWGDTYWGVYNGVGENYLGKLLMQVRQELKDGIVNSVSSWID